MEVVKKQPPIPPTSAWSTPLTFSDESTTTTQKQIHEPSSPPSQPTTSVTNPIHQPPQPQSSSQLSSSPISSSSVLRHNAQLPPSGPASHRLVRSESAPLNLLDEHPTDFSSLSISPSDNSNHPLLNRPLPSHTYSRRPPAPPSKPPPSRSQSSLCLAEFVNPSRASSSHTNSASTTSRSNLSNSKPPAPAWHKTVFDMIQDDFPRTPSPMLSALLPARPTDRRSRLASTASLDLDFDRLGTASDPNNDFHQDFASDVTSLQQKLTNEKVSRQAPSANVTNKDTSSRAAKPPLRQHRRSVSVNWAGDLGDFGDLNDLSSDAAIPRSHSRGSITSLTAPNNVSRKPQTITPSTSLNGSIATNPSAPSNVGHENTKNKSITTSDVNTPTASLFGQSDVHSNHKSQKPSIDHADTLSPTQPHSPASSLNHSHAAVSPSHSMYSMGTKSLNSDTLVAPTADEISGPVIHDYDYLYENVNDAITMNPNTANVTSHPPPQLSAFGTQPYAAAAQGIAGSPVPLSHNQTAPNAAAAVAASQYAGVFPGMGLFPSPFSTGSNGIGLNTAQMGATGATPVYPDSYRDGVADNIKTMSIQMIAILNAHQQLYAAQVAQMAALNSGFNGGGPFGTTALHAGNSLGHLGTTNGANVAGPNSIPGGSLGNSMTNGVSANQAVSHGAHPRSWDTRDTANISHRNGPRGKHHFDSTRGNGNGQLGNSKKSAGFDTNHKGRNSRGRRGHRGHDDVHLMSGSKTDRASSNITGHLQDPSNSRSPLLEEFRATSLSIGRSINPVADIGIGSPYGSTLADMQSAREWQLSEIKDHVVEFATDQHGSRFIQQKLESASAEDKDAILKQALTDAQHLMMDVFGNYVVQKLLDHGGENAVKAIASELEGRMLVLSLHMYGCRVVQKALEVVEPSSRASLVRELNGHVLKCIRDQNGNHVIQKCVELVEPESVQFIVDSVQGQSVVLAGHSYGCRVVQRILEHGAPHQKTPIMGEIMSSIPDLIKDQYGNYVIQHVVEHGTVEERSVIMELVTGEVCQLSQHKFASNVVERCLQFGSFSEREILIEILIVGEGSPNSSPLNHLVRDQFGNYVVQRVLDVAMPSQRERVVSILRAQVPAIKKYSYGKHIIARLEEHTSGQAAGTYFHHNPASTHANNNGHANSGNVSGHATSRTELNINSGNGSNPGTIGHMGVSRGDHQITSVLSIENSHDMQGPNEFSYYQ